MDLSTKQSGFTLVEAIISLTILLVISVGGVAANRIATTGTIINQNRSKANLLSVEAMEALHMARATNFLTLSPGNYHPVFSGSQWSLAPGSEIIDGFTRSITLSTVQRDLVCDSAVCDIVSEGGISDEGTYLAEVKVSWQQAGVTKELILNSLITYWR